MTPEERRKPELINGSRRGRIAKGAGSTPPTINNLLKQFKQVQQMMRSMGGMTRQGQEGQARKLPAGRPSRAFRAAEPRPSRRLTRRSLRARYRADSTSRSCVGRQDPFDARGQEEAAQLPRRRHRRAQPARRPFHRGPRAVRAACRAVGRHDRLRPRAALARRSAPSRPSRSASCSRSPACGPRTRPRSARTRRRSRRSKTPKPKTVEAGARAPAPAAAAAPQRQPPKLPRRDRRRRRRGRRDASE